MLGRKERTMGCYALLDENAALRMNNLMKKKRKEKHVQMLKMEWMIASRSNHCNKDPDFAAAVQTAPFAQQDRIGRSLQSRAVEYPPNHRCCLACLKLDVVGMMVDVGYVGADGALALLVTRAVIKSYRLIHCAYFQAHRFLSGCRPVP